MKLKIKHEWFKRAKFTKERLEQIQPSWFWNRDDKDGCEVDHTELTREELDTFAKIAREAAEAKESGAFALEQKIGILRKLYADVRGVRVTNLQELQVALVELVKSLPHHWIFAESGAGVMLPMVVTGVEYSPPSEHHTAYTRMTTAWYELGSVKTTNYTWSTGDLVGDKKEKGKAGKTAIDLLNGECAYIETPEAVDGYERILETYAVVSKDTGKQYMGNGNGVAVTLSRYSSRTIPLVVDGAAKRLIIDDEFDDEDEGKPRVQESASVTIKFDKRKSKDSDEEQVASAPLHPYVVAFDLTAHYFVKVLTNTVVPYKYDKQVEELLVLPTDVKHLVSMLVDGAARRFDDIIAGKSLGTFILSTGPAGTGKTLTAEVYSERLERPLYSVQCSQLGTDETDLEKKLQPILNRAQRWGAILLIDEADVYVRERGEDIQQNAIVGVFLRLLERYRGVIFMTSNLDSIDDAIYSRATAHVRYTLPGEHALKSIFSIQMRLAGVTAALSRGDLDVLCYKLSHRFKGCSGRTAKQLVRLAAMQRQSTGGGVGGQQVEWLDAFEAIARFQRLDAAMGSNPNTSP